MLTTIPPGPDKMVTTRQAHSILGNEQQAKSLNLVDFNRTTPTSRTAFNNVYVR